MLEEAQNLRLPAAVWQGWLAGSNPRFQLPALLINLLLKTIQLGHLQGAFGPLFSINWWPDHMSCWTRANLGHLHAILRCIQL
jgi:hypothetical protein